MVELIVVIVLIGIVGAMVGTFMRGPIDAYVDTARRAELTDIADTALRRIGEDIHGSVPASVRASADGLVMEMVLAQGGGNYDNQSASSVDVRGGWQGLISRNSLGTYFDISLYNDYNDCPAPSGLLSVYCALGATSSRISVCVAPSSAGACYSDPGAIVGNNISLRFLNPTTRSIASRAQRFQIIDGPVAYFCNATDQTLYRFSGYAIQSGMVTDFAAFSALTGVRRDIMATNVICGGSATHFSNPDSPPPPNAAEIVHMRLQLQHQGGESVLLYHDVAVINGT